jgi:hypothetical protein
MPVPAKWLAENAEKWQVSSLYKTKEMRGVTVERTLKRAMNESLLDLGLVE